MNDHVLLNISTVTGKWFIKFVFNFNLSFFFYYYYYFPHIRFLLDKVTRIICSIRKATIPNYRNLTPDLQSLHRPSTVQFLTVLHNLAGIYFPMLFLFYVSR